MDTPLYVLSTAASMVESVDVAKCQNRDEALLKPNTKEQCSSTKTVMMATTCPVSDHYQDCGEQTSDLTTNSGSLHNIPDNRRKCAGTQTSFSSFTTSPYGMPEKYVKMESANMAWHAGQKASIASSPSPPGYYQHHNTIATGRQHYGYGPSDDADMDCDMPLNLTKSSSSHQSNNNNGTTALSSPSSSPSSSSPSSPISLSSRQSLLSSCHPSATRNTESAQSVRLSVIIRNQPIHRQGSDSLQTPGNGIRDGRMSGSCDDPEIEEHFRRSLGTKYQSYMSNCASPRNGETAETFTSNTSNISITGNVDDHFAKSLGETWTQLNAQKQSSLTGTVDDHFAKALGDTWYKIKAKVETESRPSPSVVHL
ncbi:hypothetical protein LSH36_367g00021 [Paralvinella palmiformis]|uniref:Transcription cofactor vestigial-like protein 4 n=1 Tax=Paralvinella palmiformis TaxID=53620 RepID=A0AAD9JF93_9ANNE|nr:hypothetical protein LSH36_367g00021 [Paralvinella palmiformis]